MVLAIVIGVLALIVIGVMLNRAGNKMIERRLATVRAYIEEANLTRQFPPVVVPLNLQPGEIGLLSAPAQLSEMRRHRNARTRRSYESRDIVDRGTIAITTQRVAFIGAAKSLQVRYRDIMDVELSEAGGATSVYSTRRQAPLVAHYDMAPLGVVLLKLYSSVALSDNRLPEGFARSAKPDGKGGIDLQTQPLQATGSG